MDKKSDFIKNHFLVGIVTSPSYVIINRKSHRDFWSNELGWTTLKAATRFSEDEMETLNLPIDGIWTEL